MKVKAIFGPPGTGKTRTLVDIAHHEAEAGARGVMYLSYTKAAAEEAVSRSRDNRVRPSTLHSFAFNALGMNRAAVVDAKKLADFAKATGIPFKGSEKGMDEPQEGDEYATVLEFAHNRIIPHMDAWELFGRPGTAHRFENFVTTYQQWKDTFGYMDFDDMLTKFTRIPIINRAAEVVLLDEAQDCTPLQWIAFIRICENAKRVYIGGDDDQAIYEWSGANPHGMREFAEENEGDITILGSSFRVPRTVAFEAAAVINGVIERQPKRWAPRNADGKVERYGDFWKAFDLIRGGSALVLVRDGWRRQELQKEFNRAMIPYDVLGGNSPWTNSTSNALRRGLKPDIPAWWVDFYRQADLTKPINITLSTIHQAKGREHQTVLVDLQCPTKVLADFPRNPDAERRVWYVALTRTSDRLILCGENPVL